MGDEEQVENVVRFPRDWVGPPEELVPIGPRARARAREAEAEREAEQAEHTGRGYPTTDDPEPVPAAGDFWGEGAAALHHPIQAPSTDFSAPIAASPPTRAAAGDVHPRNRRARRLVRPHRAARAAQPGRVHRSVRLGRRTLIATACTGTVLIAAAVLLLTSGNGRRPDSSRATGGSFVGLAAFRSTVMAGINEIAVQVRHETHVARARAVERADRRRAAEAEAHIRRRRHEYLVELRRRRAAAAAAAAAAASSQPDAPVDTATSAPSELTTTPEVTTPEVTTPEATTPEATTPEATTPSTSDSGTSSTTAASSSGSAPAGPTGIGGSTGGCNPQCR